MSISPAQCRAGRALVNLSQAELADAASVSRATLADFERGTRTPHPNNLAAIQRALESAGVVFIDQNGHGPGVRLRQRQMTAEAYDERLDQLRDLIATDTEAADLVPGFAKSALDAFVKEALDQGADDVIAFVDQCIAAGRWKEHVLF